LHRKGNSEVWTVDLNLSPGNFDYGFEVDGKWTIDPKLPHSSNNNQVSVFHLPDFKLVLEKLIDLKEKESPSEVFNNIMAKMIGIEERLTTIEKKIDGVLNNQPKNVVTTTTPPSKTSIRISTFRTTTCMKTYPLFELSLAQKMKERIEFHSQKKSWFTFSKALSVSVDNKPNISAFGTDTHIILCCGYSPSSRLDAETILPFKKALTEKTNAKVICTIFRFGQDAAAASIKDSQDSLVSDCLCFSFDSKGWLDTNLSEEALNFLWEEISKIDIK